MSEQNGKREVRIYCPKCSWEPVPSSRWYCVCGCCWNTFETAGVCPEWETTQCLSCHRHSAHSAWYHEFVGDRREVEEKVEEPTPTGV